MVTLHGVDAKTILIAVGASARLFRLYQRDDAGEPLRAATNRALARISDSAEPGSFRERAADALHEGAGCPFCVGFWTALAVCAGPWRSRTYTAVVTALAVNYAAAHLNAKLDPPPPAPSDEAVPDRDPVVFHGGE